MDGPLPFPAVLPLNVVGRSGIVEHRGHGILTDMPMITGAFEVTLKLYVHSLDSGDDATIFEITEPDGNDKIKILRDNSDRMQFEVRGYNGFEDADSTPHGTEVLGEEAMWKFGVDTDGYMYINKNGVELARDYCGPMRPGARDDVTFMFDEGTDPVGMSMLAFRLENTGVTRQIFGSIRYFLATFFAQFELGGDRSIFEFGNADNFIWMDTSSNTIKLEIFQDGQWFRLKTGSVLVSGSMNRGAVGINSAGELYINSDDTRIASTDASALSIPHHVFRRSMLLGRSNVYTSKGSLTGAIFGLRVDRTP